MKTLFEKLSALQTPNRVLGTWRLESRYGDFAYFVENYKKLAWNKNTLMHFNQRFVEHCSVLLEVGPDTIERWMSDPECVKFRDAAMVSHSLDDSHLQEKRMLADLLRMVVESIDVKLQIQMPGEMIAWHLDTKKERLFSASNDQSCIHRYALFLDDQKPGQVWQINDDYVKWCKGDILHWDHTTAPHGTANFGFDARPIMVITGMCTKINLG
jgi:hypothetical protein